MHGAGNIKAIEEKEILGEKQQYYVIEMPGEVMVMVPTAKAESMGVRSVIDKQSANNVQASANTGYTSNVSGSDQAAKAWIAQRESSNNYNARNGQYIGKYQLSSSYLNGDYSPANQERVADQYVASRYGSWTGAQQFWQSHGWY